MNKPRLVLGTIVTLASLSTAHAQFFPVSFNVHYPGYNERSKWNGPVGEKHLMTVSFQNFSDTAYNALDWEFVLLDRTPYNDAFKNLDVKIKLSTRFGRDEIIAPLQSRTVSLYYNYEALTATQPAYGSFRGVFRLRHEGQLYVSHYYSHTISPPIAPPPVPEPATALLFMPAAAWIIRKRQSTQRTKTAA